ncbi:MAG: DUF2164 domain-containing protein [Firmicutes bacterium HGW-Firmicutes-5]|nr:MAG: DUF2164 domain-containing protein [Firmicutes bacterium HGW-Firmicutes-5]
MNNQIKLSKEKREDMIALIKAYFLKERDEELGDLASGFFLDFITENLAADFYNQDVWDAYTYMNVKIEDLLEIQKY